MAFNLVSNFNTEMRRWDLQIVDELDVSTAAKLRAEIDRIFEKTKANICIDATKLSYMDSTGLGVIIGAYGRMKENGGYRIVIVNPRDNIKKLLSVTSLDKILCVE